MNAGRTVTVQTRDHGPVTVPEPDWCIGQSHEVVGDFRADISHYGPAVVLTVDTTAGARELLTLALAQHLESGVDRWPGTALHVTALLADGYHPYDVAGLDRLADDLVDAAHHVRQMARHLDVVSRAGGGR